MTEKEVTRYIQTTYRFDGNYTEEEIEDILYRNDDEQKEKSLTEYILLNINKLFPEKILSIDRGNCIPINRKVRNMETKARKYASFVIDLLIKTEKEHKIIEVKTPRYYGPIELLKGITQLQLYGMVYEEIFDIKPKLILITNKINKYVTDYLAKYTPAIDLIVVTKQYTMKLQKND